MRHLHLVSSCSFTPRLHDVAAMLADAGFSVTALLLDEAPDSSQALRDIRAADAVIYL